MNLILRVGTAAAITLAIVGISADKVANAQTEAIGNCVGCAVGGPVPLGEVLVVSGVLFVPLSVALVAARGYSA